MRIKELQLKNFKRFTDLKIENIQPSIKLVLLIGANGSGKSSVFDAFEWLSRPVKRGNILNDDTYFKKDTTKPIEISIVFSDGSEIRRLDNNYPSGRELSSKFHGRSSLRIVPRIENRAGFNESTLSKDLDAPERYIDYDNQFQQDVVRFTNDINKALRDPVFRGQQADTLKIFQDYIKPFNDSLRRIFGTDPKKTIRLVQYEDAIVNAPAKLIFEKGNSRINFDLLSHGEKQIVITLINFVVRVKFFQDTIYFIDEMDVHLNTALQFAVIKDITENWLPDNCQLWAASHSLGFIEYAKNSEFATIIDFDEIDFDLNEILVPEPKDSHDVYDIAVGKEYLPALFQQMTIFFVENKDKAYYAEIGIQNTIFVSDNNRNNVYHKVKATSYRGIVDRDFLSDDDIEQIKHAYSNLRILNYYSIENYMYHPDNLEEYYNNKKLQFNKQQYITQITTAKNQVKNTIIPSLSLKRTEYPYFGEPEYNGTPLQNRFKNKQENMDQSTTIATYLNSDEFEVYYKSLPMKSYCTNLSQRQNIAKSELVKTEWFKSHLEIIINH